MAGGCAAGEGELAQAQREVDTLGEATVAQRIAAGSGTGFRTLALGAGEPYIVREEGVGVAHAGREASRRSLVYLGQLSDFQLADEESPVRTEYLDAGPAAAAWRPWEALAPHIDDAMVRQLDAFAPASPIAAGDGSHAAMDFVINTGDATDNVQLNETLWARTLMQGGALDPNSGVDPAGNTNLTCILGNLLGQVPRAAEAARYTGVQDYTDYLEGPSPQYYDPNLPRGAFAMWPAYPGLIDRAQQPFHATGLVVPAYMTFGNHDALVQGNIAANAAVELVATGCLKIMVPVSADARTLGTALASLNATTLLAFVKTQPGKVVFVPPDPRRQFVSKRQYKQIFRDGTQADGFGFGYIDPAEEAASHGAAGYYTWRPKSGIRFISLDTISESGVAEVSADGNIDDPQFQWLRRTLDAATAAHELVVIFSHHAIESLGANLPDEVAAPCTIADAHGHDINPGCDLDPRSSQPIHLGADLVTLLHQHPLVVAWIAGHSHLHSINAYRAPDGHGGFWSIRVAAEADWPQQSRLIEIFDNHDGTLSLFGTVVDHAGPAAAPLAGTPAADFSLDALASIGRTLSYNDTQSGGRACNGGPCGEGSPADRNVELLVADPR